MNLLQRATPKTLEALERFTLEFPNIGASIKRDLTSTEFITELRFGTVCDLISMCGDGNSMFQVFDMFKELI